MLVAGAGATKSMAMRAAARSREKERDLGDIAKVDMNRIGARNLG